MFETTSIPEARAIAVLKKAFVGVILALLAIGGVSSYRAYVQVRSVAVISDQLLTKGSNVNVSVVTSGRTQVDVQVQLVQDSQSKTLFSMHIPGNELGFFDPRSQHASENKLITSEQLSGFRSGIATLRATATGRHQWMRLPPPTVREVEVQIRLE